MSLAPHPIGIKFYTGLWKNFKDLSFEESTTRFAAWWQQTLHRKLAGYYYTHRRGTIGVSSILVFGFLGFKTLSGFYMTQRDQYSYFSFLIFVFVYVYALTTFKFVHIFFVSCICRFAAVTQGIAYGQGGSRAWPTPK